MRIRTIRSLVDTTQDIWAKFPEDLTVIIVARNLVKLFYPFPESFVSVVPLGARFLIGDFESEDNTQEIYRYLSTLIPNPVEILNLKWPKINLGGRAIGAATELLMKQVKTPYVFNLQACEVIVEEAGKNILKGTGPLDFQFRHFFGSCYHDLARGYKVAPRIFPNTRTMKSTDGWAYDGWKAGTNPVAGWIHRYSYCFENEAWAKADNHFALYDKIGGEPPDQKMAEVHQCSRNPNFFARHPEIVSHMVNGKNYDLQLGLSAVKRILCP